MEVGYPHASSNGFFRSRHLCLTYLSVCASVRVPCVLCMFRVFGGSGTLGFRKRSSR